MRRNLLTKLMCPGCRARSGALDWSSGEEHDAWGGAREIRTGTVSCRACGAAYVIRDGILDLLPHLAPALERERRGIAKLYDAKAGQRDEEVLLQQPWIHDPENPTHWESIAANFAQACQWLDERDSRQNRARLTLVDLGAGSCWSTAALAKAGYSCVALDISDHPKAGLRAAEVRMRAGAPLFDRIVADMGTLPFQDECVDRVVTMDAVHHALDLAATFAEIHRVLVPGGILLSIAEPVQGILRNRHVGQMEIEAYGWNEHSYSRAEYGSTAARAGFHYEMLFPASVDERVRRRHSGSKPLNRLLGGVAGAAWRIAALRQMIQGPLFGPLQSLLGLPMTIVAIKQRDGRASRP